MANSVFIVRPDSIYDDIPSEQYQFPKQYLERVKQSVGDWIIYLEPRKVTDTRGYFALAKVQDIIPDRRADGMFLAVILPGSMMEFGAHVPFRVDNDVVERGVLNSAGKISGRAQSAVRPLSSPDFERICTLGLDTSALPRVDAHEQPGFAEGESAYDFGSLAERAMTFSSRKVRDANFRNAVISAYDRRCAISGLKLINGLGRAEVEAAHIKSVEANGPDIVQNGVALSGTVHWMFDRGLISLSDNLEILISRQVNDYDAVRSTINPSGHLLSPKRLGHRPHPSFLKWHRENCFKA